MPLDKDYSIRQLQFLAFLSIVWMTGHRCDGVHRLNSNGWSKIAAQREKPRALLFESLVVGKDLDHQRRHDPIDYKNYVPCLCFILCQDELQKSLFARELQGNSECSCIEGVGCPYGHIVNYLNQCPDPSGKAQDEKIALDLQSTKPKHDLKPLRLMRALCNTRKQSDRKFTIGNVGLSTLKESYDYFNKRLPEHLKVTNPTGHSGRISFMNNARMGGASDLGITAATHHTGGKSSVGYLDGNDQTIGTEGGLAIGHLIVASTKEADITTKIGGFVIAPPQLEANVCSPKQSSSDAITLPGLTVTPVQDGLLIDAVPANTSNSNERRANYIFNFSGSGNVHVQNS